jgi:hypothetical protein
LTALDALMPVETALIKRHLRELAERTASLRGFL